MENRDELKYEIEVLERLKSDSLKHGEEFQRKNDLMTGVILGLIYGIIGNLFVQFFYPVIEGLVNQSYNSVFVASVIVSIVALVIIGYTAFAYRRKLNRVTQSEKKVQEDSQRLENTIQKRKHQLEALEKLMEQKKEWDKMMKDSVTMMDLGE